MNIGVPRERRPDENRVGLTPTRVNQLAAEGHRVYVEQGAGLGAGFTDDHFSRAGAQIVYSGEEVYGRAELVVKVARPQNEELRWLLPGQTVMAFWHLASAAPDKLKSLLSHDITAVAYEMIQTDDGGLPVLRAMSQIAGRMAAHVAASLLQNNHGGKGVLLGGVPGVPPAEVIILGAGVVGQNAAKAFAGLGATVYVLDSSLERLEIVAAHNERVITMIAHPGNVEKVVHFADVVVGAVLIPGQRTPLLVSRSMVRNMRRRAVIIDIAIDQGGCVETSRPTTHREPTFVAEDIMHYCVPNMTGVLGRTATHALTNATWPFVQLVTREQAAGAIEQSRVLARGVVTHAGRILAPGLGGEVSL